MRKLLILCLLALAAGARAQQTNSILLPGPRPDGSVLLPNGWSLRPAGKQIPLGDFPVSIAVHPGGRYAAVLHCGYGKHEVWLIDIPTDRVVSRLPIHEGFYGLEFSPSGSRLFCSGGADEVIRVFDFNNGKLTESEPIQVHDPKPLNIPCGMAFSEDARQLYVANVWGQRISEIDLWTRSNRLDFLLVPASKNGSMLDVAEAKAEARAQLDPQNAAAPFPYGCRVDGRRHRLYVSEWARGCVAAVDLNTHQVIGVWPAGDHPNEMVLSRDGGQLYVANGNLNTVTILDTIGGNVIETLNTGMSTTGLPGSTPNSVALSPDESKLFVANACNNNVAVFDVSRLGHSHALGLIPVGWYPTSVRVTPDGKHLLVANGKGLTSLANPNGPQPGRKHTGPNEYIGTLFHGALSVIDLPGDAEFRQQLAGYTQTALACAPDKSLPQVTPSPWNPVPAQVGKPSPLKYCIYIIKENRTYDQVLGDMPQGNGDPSLCLFPEKVTPNLHAICRDFVLLDNFYADAEVSADGHEWSMGGIATDFVEKSWPLNYGHHDTGKWPYPSEGHLGVAFPKNGYIWDRCREAGVTYRSYGEFVSGGGPGDPGHTLVLSLQDHFDPMFRTFDLAYPDAKRADRFISELQRFSAAGDMPRLQIVRLPNDHTEGTSLGALTPTSYVAENDLAVGRVIEAVSRSPFWLQTAIFIIEDDAQNGPDHVDAHRTTAYLVSPYSRHRGVDHTMYSTTSMLRTMELILGLQPLTQFDAAATPMYNSFGETPDATPWKALPAGVSLTELNTKLSWGTTESAKMNFAREDAADDRLLNEVIWRSVRGADHPMPAPNRSGVVFTSKGDQDDD